MPKVKKVAKTSPTTKNVDQEKEGDSDEPPRKKASKRSASVAALAAITNSQEAEAVADEELFKVQPIEAKKKAVAIGNDATTTLCSRNFRNVKLRFTLQEFICHSILREINYGRNLSTYQKWPFYHVRDSQL